MSEPIKNPMTALAEAQAAAAAAFAAAAAVGDFAGIANPQPAEILTLPEAAVFLRTSEEVVRQEAGSGRIPGKLVAGEWRFSRSALLDWLSRPDVPPQKSSKERMLALAGMWKGEDDSEALAKRLSRRGITKPKRRA